MDFLSSLHVQSKVYMHRFSSDWLLGLADRCVVAGGAHLAGPAARMRRGGE
jgi:hypothetical protein